MLIIWFTSLASVVFISRFKRGQKYIIISLNALAVGTLLADAMLHIIPQVKLTYCALD